MKTTLTKRVKFHSALRSVEQRILRLEPDVSPEPVTVENQPKDTVDLETGPAPPTPHLAELLEDIGRQIDDLRVAREQNIAELHELAVQLSLAIAAHVVKRELDANQLNLNEIVSAAIGQLFPASKIVVRIHPDSGNSIKEHQSDLFDELEIVEDSSLPRGSCLVSNDEIGLFSSLEGRLENIRDTLLQGIEYARTERRTPDQLGNALRRFPDRRKPA